MACRTAYYCPLINPNDFSTSPVHCTLAAPRFCVFMSPNCHLMMMCFVESWMNAWNAAFRTHLHFCLRARSCSLLPFCALLPLSTRGFSTTTINAGSILRPTLCPKFRSANFSSFPSSPLLWTRRILVFLSTAPTAWWTLHARAGSIRSRAMFKLNLPSLAKRLLLFVRLSHLAPVQLVQLSRSTIAFRSDALMSLFSTR